MHSFTPNIKWIYYYSLNYGLSCCCRKWISNSLTNQVRDFSSAVVWNEYNIYRATRGLQQKEPNVANRKFWQISQTVFWVSVLSKILYKTPIHIELNARWLRLSAPTGFVLHGTATTTLHLVARAGMSLPCCWWCWNITMNEDLFLCHSLQGPIKQPRLPYAELCLSPRCVCVFILGSPFPLAAFHLSHSLIPWMRSITSAPRSLRTSPRSLSAPAP